MKDNDSTPGLALGLAVVLGILADRLLPEGPAGPGFALWILLLGAAAVFLARRAGSPGVGAVAGWSALATAAAAATILRDTEILILMMWLVLISAASMVLLRAGGVRLWETRPADHILGLVLVPGRAAAGLVPLLTAIQPPQGSSRRRLVAVGRGILLSAPLLLLFGALFASADAGFDRFATTMIRMWSEDFLTHLLIVLVFSWIAAGLLSGVRARRLPSPLSRLTPPRLGSEETAVVLGLLALLFLTFVGFQLGYLFGGREAIEAASGLTLAEYARRGFFELMVVGVVTIAVLLVADALTTARRLFRWLAAVLVACALVILVSAVQRLMLYTDAFGLTVDRIAAATVMAWVAAVLVLFSGTVLRERPGRFSSGALIAGIVAAFSLVLLDPGEIAARSILDRAAAGERAADVAYLARLGADAVPTILARMDELPPAARCELWATLQSRWGDQSDLARRNRDWRTWKLAGAAARRALRASATAVPASC